VIVYRITGTKHAADLSGTGAALYGGRWNKKGVPVLYTGESKEIALLETLAHTPPYLIPELDVVSLQIPDSIFELSVKELPKNWKDYPAPSVLSEIGDNWQKEGEYLALKVPSCIIPSAYNYVLNCQHPDYRKHVKIKNQKRFELDSRLLR